jgi:hypothetical protein
MDHPCHVCFKLAEWFQRRKLLNNFPIGFYVKTMSADGGHLGWKSGSQDIILKVDHLRTIHAMNVLKWSTFKIISSDPDFHPRCLPSADIVLT